MESIAPIFISSDLNRTEEFFADILDFKTEGKHKDYLVMRNGKVNIHFSKLFSVNKRKNNCACYLRTDDFDRLYEKCAELECLHPNGKLSDNPWGREFAILDPDWNLVKVVG